MAIVLKSTIDAEIKDMAKKRAPEAIQAAQATICPHFARLVDEFTMRLDDFVASAGDKLYRGIGEILTRAIEERRGGTFTISNLGAIGGTYSTPIINPPEVAILLAGRSRILPQYLDGQLEPRLMMPLSITYDHRIVDGAAAARFLNEVKGYLANPGRLLLAP